jgi:hypothetical protein
MKRADGPTETVLFLRLGCSIDKMKGDFNVSNMPICLSRGRLRGPCSPTKGCPCIGVRVVNGVVHPHQLQAVPGGSLPEGPSLLKRHIWHHQACITRAK